MHCPYHGDSHRSASINIEKRLWWCHGCSEGGPIEPLLLDYKEWEIPEFSSSNGNSGEVLEEITETKIEGWHSGLLGRPQRVAELRERKGLTKKTLIQFEIGWDADNNAYTIPIRDAHGDICNVRRYQFDVPDDRRKIWSVKGMGTPTLYPMDQLEAQRILICEGEWDALLSIQNGVPAITRTGAADVWRSQWSHQFAGKGVWICHDADTKGQIANRKVAASLRRVADSIRIVDLPYEITEKHGKDLGDWWMEGHTRKDFTKIALESEVVETLKEALHPENPEQAFNISVTDSFNPEYVEKALRMEVTVTGKRVPSHLVPKKVHIECDMNAGKRCDSCTMNTQGYQGHLEFEIADDSPFILHMVDAPEAVIHQMVAMSTGAQKCDRLKVTTLEARTVEEIYVRPSIEKTSTTDIEDQDFTHRRVYSTVTHNLLANQTIELVGTIRANPRNSLNEFQAWQVEKPMNTLDSFELSAEMHEDLKVFQERDETLKKLEDIADDMAQHVTRIYGRKDLHIFIDLIYHSILHIPFGLTGETERGWLDGLVIGDTRTGKSEVTGKMVDLYGMGEMVSCESATYAGVVGGLDRIPSGAWIVKWGVIPVNDRRLVALDEVSGLTTEQIAQMSSIRSTGVAEMTKINSERAMARTRLVWLANPRNARMSDYIYGIQALRPLIGNPEDIARFDMAMAVYSADVQASVINRDHRGGSETRYPRESYRALVQWAWTRKPHHVKWRGQCRQEIFKAATRLGEFYDEIPPLIQGANARVKIARIATAMAARTFSTDPTGQEVWVTTAHVLAAEEFLNRIYSHPKFGYSTVSTQQSYDTEKTVENLEEITAFLANERGLVRYMRANPILDSHNMGMVMNMSPEKCGNMITKLWELRAVRLDGTQLRAEQPVLDLLRDMKDSSED